MKAWTHALVVSLLVGSTTSGCKFTTCAADDPDCAKTSLFDDAGTRNTTSRSGATSSNAGSGTSKAGATSLGGATGAGTGDGGPTSTGGAGDTTLDAGQGGESTAGAGGASTTPVQTVADMCSEDGAGLDACNECINRVCCDELLGCSNSLECAGAYEETDEGTATADSEIGCVRDDNAYLANPDNANPDDLEDPVLGYASEDSVALAMERCAEKTTTGALAPETTALVECLLYGVGMTDDGGMPAYGDCATACLGIEF